jgi:hypothetical protein
VAQAGGALDAFRSGNHDELYEIVTAGHDRGDGTCQERCPAEIKPKLVGAGHAPAGSGGDNYRADPRGCH